MRPREASLGAESGSVRRGLAAAALCAAALGCHTDTTGLERRETTPSASAGAGGQGASAGPPGGSAGQPSLMPDEPSPTSGVGSLAVLDGLVDGGSLFICLRDLASGSPLGSDVPDPAAGLEFGRFRRIALDWDLAASDVEVELYTAAAGAPQAQSCEALRASADAARAALSASRADAGTDAGTAPPPAGAPRGAGSVTLARGSLFAGRHYALVATGCAAPETLAAPEVCGPPDPLLGSRSELVLVEFGAEMTEGGRYFGLQFLNASRALGLADVSLQVSGPPDRSVPFVSGVSFGVLRPRVVATVEQPLALELRGRGGPSVVAYSQLWAETLAASALELEPGKNYLLTSIGPVPSADGGGRSTPRLVLIPAE